MTYAPYYDQSPTKDVARESVPTFNPLNPFIVGTAQEIMPDKDFARQSSFTPLWNITANTKRYCLAKPLKIHIYHEGNTFFAENENLVIIGNGASIDEAIIDFTKHIIYFHRYYKNLPLERATGDAKRLKNIYETLFFEED
jgi:hypothetical protein